MSNYRCAHCGLLLFEPVYFETVHIDGKQDNGFGIPIPFGIKEVTLPFCNGGCAKAYMDECGVPA